MKYGDWVRLGANLDIDEFELESDGGFRRQVRARLSSALVGVWPGDQAWARPSRARMVRSEIVGGQFDVAGFERLLAEFAAFRHDCLGVSSIWSTAGRSRFPATRHAWI